VQAWADHFISVDLGLLADRAARNLSAEETRRVVGVGTSGSAFAKMITPRCAQIGVETVRFSRIREQRILQPEQVDLDFVPVLVDDLAVSGLTLAAVNKITKPTASTCLVGMLKQSRATRRLIAMDDIRAGMVYSREGGGNPPINSIGTLLAVPKRLDNLVDRYFQNSRLFKQIVRGEVS